MPFSTTVYRVFIASPSDLSSTRQAVEQEIQQWNRDNSENTGVTLQPVRWETDATPEMGDRPQAIINRQLVDQADILIGFFHSRIGSSTGDEESGTVEEINRFMDSGRPTLIYFSTADLPIDADLTQVQRVRDLKHRVRQKGITGQFAANDDFRVSLSRHITATVQALVSGTRNPDTSLTDAHASERIQHEVRSSPIEQLNETLSQLEDLNRRFRVAWNTERQSRSPGIEDGQALVARTRAELSEFRTNRSVDSRPIIASAIDVVLVNLARLVRHQLYIDGGRSYEEFWSLCGDAVARLEAVERFIRAAVYTGRALQTGDDLESMKTRKACLRLAVGPGRGFPWSTTGGERLKIEVPIRNEGDDPAYDVAFEATEQGSTIGTADIVVIEPNETKSVRLWLSLTGVSDPPTPQDRIILLRLSFRDGLGPDQAQFAVHFTGIVGSSFQGEPSPDRSILSPLCSGQELPRMR